MISKFILMIVLFHLVASRFTDVPPPPKRPNRFNSREELKRYLQKVHEYHSIVDRWRLRRHTHDYLPASDDVLFQFFDINHDHFITPIEFARRLETQPQHQQ